MGTSIFSISLDIPRHAFHRSAARGRVVRPGGERAHPCLLQPAGTGGAAHADGAQALPQVAGTLSVEGLSAPVQIVRDRWGIPHITAQTQDDLFVAQGSRAGAGSPVSDGPVAPRRPGPAGEVLGANFIERDAMTRRMQPRGSAEVEWASYGRDAQAIACGIRARHQRVDCHCAQRSPRTVRAGRAGRPSSGRPTTCSIGPRPS